MYINKKASYFKPLREVESPFKIECLLFLIHSVDTPSRLILVSFKPPLHDQIFFAKFRVSNAFGM